MSERASDSFCFTFHSGITLRLDCFIVSTTFNLNKLPDLKKTLAVSVCLSLIQHVKFTITDISIVLKEFTGDDQSSFLHCIS